MPRPLKRRAADRVVRLLLDAPSPGPFVAREWLLRDAPDPNTRRALRAELRDSPIIAQAVCTHLRESCQERRRLLTMLATELYRSGVPLDAAFLAARKPCFFDPAVITKRELVVRGAYQGPRTLWGLLG